MVAGEQHVFLLERIGHVIGGVAGGRHRFDGPALAAHHLTVLERDIGAEVAVGAGVERIMLADMQRPRGAMRAFGIDGSAGRRLDRRHRRRMIAMGVGNENMRHRLVAHGRKQRGDMGGIARSGIDNCDAALADDIAERALEGERPRIVRHDAAYAGHRFIDGVGRELEIFIEGDVVGHGPMHMTTAFAKVKPFGRPI